MITNIEEYRKKKQLISQTGLVKIPVYKRVFLEGSKLIGEATNGRKDIITDYDKEEN